MNWTEKRMDYHLHTHHSMDGSMTLDTLCRAALKADLAEICITDHTEFGHPAEGSDRPPVMEAWWAELTAAREAYPELVIRAGMEIGDNPRVRDAIMRWHLAQPLDFMLLSLHLVNNRDPFFSDFYDHGTQETLYRRYVEAKLESTLAWPAQDYDAIAHLGYVAKFAPYPVKTRPLRLHHAPDVLDALFIHLAQNGKALEINTSGHKTMGECIPDAELLGRFAALGGEFVTLGSDAHEPAFVGRWIDDAAELAKSCGIRYALTFSARRPIPVKL